MNIKRNYWYIGLSEWFKTKFLGETKKVRAKKTTKKVKAKAKKAK